MGSEMCIRDRAEGDGQGCVALASPQGLPVPQRVGLLQPHVQSRKGLDPLCTWGRCGLGPHPRVPLRPDQASCSAWWWLRGKPGGAEGTKTTWPGLG